MSDTPNRDDLEGATVEHDTPDVTALLKRIDRLERTVEGLQGELQQSSFARWAMRRTRGNATRSVEAGEFIVRDAKGQRRAKLGMGADGWVRLRLYDATGERCASLGVAPDGRARLRLYDQAGEPRAGLAVFPDDLGEGLVLKDQTGHPRITISLLDDGSGDVTIRSADGKILWRAP